MHIAGMFSFLGGLLGRFCSSFLRVSFVLLVVFPPVSAVWNADAQAQRAETAALYLRVSGRPIWVYGKGVIH